MRVIRKEFYNVKRNEIFTIIPLGDIHIGSAACDERRLRQVIKRIETDDHCYWLGMGDYAEWINRNDKRFDPATLAEWVEVADLVDLSKAQRDRFLELVKPIAGKCLCLVEGNHEATIRHFTERDIFAEIVAGVKECGGFDPADVLGLGVYGWLRLVFYRRRDREASTTFTFNIHHGFVGGKLAGAKALNMQRWLWSHNADLVLFGHSHNTGVQVEAVETLDRAENLVIESRVGAFSGTFRETVNPDGPAIYSEAKGYFPVPMAGVEIRLHPGSKQRSERLRVIA